MKLRFRHNSIRFRLAQSDVRSLRTSGRCRETILFPGGSELQYVLLSSAAKDVSVIFCDGVVAVAVPVQQLTEWHSSDQVGISAAVEVAAGKKLDILIEKDFRCLDPLILEDQSDAFANPLSIHATC